MIQILTYLDSTQVTLGRVISFIDSSNFDLPKIGLTRPFDILLEIQEEEEVVITNIKLHSKKMVRLFLMFWCIIDTVDERIAVFFSK